MRQSGYPCLLIFAISCPGHGTPHASILPCCPPPPPQHALPPYPLLLPLLVLLQYRDLPADTYLSLSVYELSEGRPMLLVGSTSMPLFSKKGRLKTGQQRLQVCLTH